MRTGKTQASLQTIVEQLNKGNSVFVAELKDKDNYVNRLNKDFNIEVVVIPHYVTPSLTNKYHLHNDKLTEYLPTISGYEFRRK